MVGLMPRFSFHGGIDQRFFGPQRPGEDSCGGQGLRRWESRNSTERPLARWPSIAKSVVMSVVSPPMVT